MNSIVPYASMLVQYLQNMLDNTPESEISKELIYKSNYKMVRKIIVSGKYDFDNPK